MCCIRSSEIVRELLWPTLAVKVCLRPLHAHSAPTPRPLHSYSTHTHPFIPIPYKFPYPFNIHSTHTLHPLHTHSTSTPQPLGISDETHCLPLHPLPSSLYQTLYQHLLPLTSPPSNPLTSYSLSLNSIFLPLTTLPHFKTHSSPSPHFRPHSPPCPHFKPHSYLSPHF